MLFPLVKFEFTAAKQFMIHLILWYAYDGDIFTSALRLTCLLDWGYELFHSTTWFGKWPLRGAAPTSIGHLYVFVADSVL